MNVQCLTSDEVGALLQYLLDEKTEINNSLNKAFQAARAWELCIVCHNLFVARHLDVTQRGCDKIERFYSVDSEIAIDIQEGSIEFVEYLLQHERNYEETLDEAIILIQEGLSNHEYKKVIRY